MALIDKLTAIADAIRGKNGKTEEMTLDQMVVEIGAIETGGSGWTADGIASRTEPKGDLNFSVNIICDYAFYKNTAITSITGENVAKIGEFAFSECGTLKEVNLPNVETIGVNGFFNTNITTFNSSTLKEMKTQCFRNCKALVNFSAENLETLTGQSILRECNVLDNVILGSVNTLSKSLFESCPKLRYVDVKSTNQIDKWAFWDCSALEAIVIRGGNVPTLVNVDAFEGSSIASGTGFIYVPSAVLGEYITATNWSVYAGQLRAIEGSEYE